MIVHSTRLAVAQFTKPRSQKGRAVLCARVAQDKLAHDLLILDLTEIESAPADFFVIATCDSEAQLRAVTDSIDTVNKSLGMGNPKVQGLSTSHWVILDYFDIVVHLMLTETREFYKLERLWGDAKAYTLTPAGAPKVTTITRNKV